MNIRLKRIIIWGLVCWGILPFIVASAYKLLNKTDSSAKTEKTSGSVTAPGSLQYDSFFEGNFNVKLSPDKDSHNKKRMAFFKDGTAILQHDNTYTAIFDFYTYKPAGGCIHLKGDRVVTIRSSGIRVLPDIPDDIILHTTNRTDSVIMEGSSSKNKQTYQLCSTEGCQYSRIPMKAFDAVRSCKRISTLSPDSLWVVKTDRISVSTGKNSGTICKHFRQGELIYGSTDPEDNAYIRLPYAKGSYAYVDACDVEKVGTHKRLTALLAEDGLRSITLMNWIKEFDQIEWRNATMGYFNGWKAGRLAVEFFFYFMGWMLLILLLNRTSGWFNHIWPIVSKTTIVALTLVELWYAGSLGLDAYWFIFDTTPVIAIAAFICLSGLFILQSWLLNAVESDLYLDNDTYSSVPAWVEYTLVIILSVASIPLAIAASNAVTGLGVFVVYGTLMLAILPSTISLHRHSNKSRPLVLFMLICEPMRYIIILYGLVVKIFSEVAEMKNKFEGPEESDSVSAVDALGNTVNLHRLPNGPFMDEQGRLYEKSGNSFYPYGPGDNRPFQKV